MTQTQDFYRVAPEEASALGVQILAILKQARSANLRITGAELANRLEHANDRRIRVVIEQLIEQGHLIAASNQTPMGYFLIETKEDAAIYEATLRSRAVKTLKRLSNFRKAVARKFGDAYQLPLFTINAAIKELE